MGPIEAHLRRCCSWWPDIELTVACIGAMYEARRLVYHCARGRGLAQVFRDGDMPDVLSEAIEAAEALGL